MITCFVDIKKAIHGNYNEIVETQRVVNINQLGFSRAMKNMHREMTEEIDLHDANRNIVLDKMKADMNER